VREKPPIATGTGREARASYWHGERCGCRSRGEEPLRGGGCRTGGALGGERGPQATRFVNAVVSAGLGGHAPSGGLRRAGRRPAGDTQGDGTRLFLRGYLRGFGVVSLSDTIK